MNEGDCIDYVFVYMIQLLWVNDAVPYGTEAKKAQQ